MALEWGSLSQYKYPSWTSWVSSSLPQSSGTAYLAYHLKLLSLRQVFALACSTPQTCFPAAECSIARRQRLPLRQDDLRTIMCRYLSLDKSVSDLTIDGDVFQSYSTKLRVKNSPCFSPSERGSAMASKRRLCCAAIDGLHELSWIPLHSWLESARLPCAVFLDCHVWVVQSLPGAGSNVAQAVLLK